MEVCEELRKRKVDVCCLQEVRWKGEGTRFFGIVQFEERLVELRDPEAMDL